MSAHEIDYQVEADGRIRLDGLPVKRGQSVKLVLLLPSEPEAAEAGPSAPADRHPGYMDGGLLSSPGHRYEDPFGPAVDPQEWDVERDA